MGGQAKARGTREERVAKAMEKKKMEQLKYIDKEISWCYHQRYFEDNIKLFQKEIIGRREEDNEKLYVIIKRDFKKMSVGEFFKSSYKDYELYPFLSTVIKKQSLIVCKVIFETIYGLCSINLSPNGTAGWHITNTSGSDILDKCYDRIIMMEYISEKIFEEDDEE